MCGGCNNGGKCVMLPNGKHGCACEVGFSGKHCDIDICDQEDKCLNGGVCKRLARDSMECICPKG